MTSTEERMRSLAVEMLSIDEDKLSRVTLPYNDEITAMTLTFLECISRGNLSAAKMCVERAFYEGYLVGQKTKATDFDSAQWVEAEP